MSNKENIAEYLIAFIKEYAKYKTITEVIACKILKSNGILDYLEEHYNIAHTLTFDSVIELVESKIKKTVKNDITI